MKTFLEPAFLDKLNAEQREAYFTQQKALFGGNSSEQKNEIFTKSEFETSSEMAVPKAQKQEHWAAKKED
jgi:hypothetical protein